MQWFLEEFNDGKVQLRREHHTSEYIVNRDADQSYLTTAVAAFFGDDITHPGFE